MNLQLVTAIYRPLAAGTHELMFCDSLGRPPIGLSLLLEGSDELVMPLLVSGSVEGIDAPRFLRGDANGDGVFNGLADALVILDFGFLGGGVPLCLDSADANDDGVVVGLLDALTILNHQFILGAPPLPAPGSAECGVDPTVDFIGCNNPPNCP